MLSQTDILPILTCPHKKYHHNRLVADPARNKITGSPCLSRHCPVCGPHWLVTWFNIIRATLERADDLGQTLYLWEGSAEAWEGRLNRTMRRTILHEGFIAPGPDALQADEDNIPRQTGGAYRFRTDTDNALAVLTNVHLPGARKLSLEEAVVLAEKLLLAIPFEVRKPVASSGSWNGPRPYQAPEAWERVGPVPMTPESAAVILAEAGFASAKVKTAPSGQSSVTWRFPDDWSQERRDALARRLHLRPAPSANPSPSEACDRSPPASPPPNDEIPLGGLGEEAISAKSQEGNSAGLVIQVRELIDRAIVENRGQRELVRQSIKLIA